VIILFDSIYWYVYSKATTKQKVMKVFSSLENSLGTKLELTGLESYTEGDYFY